MLSFKFYLQGMLFNFDCIFSQSNHIEGAKASMDAYEPDQEAWKRICLAFLKGSPLL